MVKVYNIYFCLSIHYYCFSIKTNTRLKLQDYVKYGIMKTDAMRQIKINGLLKSQVLQGRKGYLCKTLSI